MENKECNGWTNYETWTVALWIDNDQVSYNYWRAMAKWHREQAPNCREVIEEAWTVEQAAKYNLADQLKKEIEGGSPIEEVGVYADLLRTALSEVDWLEIAEHIFEDALSVGESLFGSVVFAYTRAQAISDGVLIDVSDTAREAGIIYPTAVTSTVWQDYVVVPEGVSGQDEQGRLWDILWMLRCTILGGGQQDKSHMDFSLLVRNDNHAPKTVTLKSICGPGDNGESVITIMMPGED